jgi:hypothetical protein
MSSDPESSWLARYRGSPADQVGGPSRPIFTRSQWGWLRPPAMADEGLRECSLVRSASTRLNGLVVSCLMLYTSAPTDCLTLLPSEPVGDLLSVGLREPWLGVNPG